MWHFSSRATKVLHHPGAFGLAVIKSFRANQGILLAGAVAYYTLLSLVPLLILIFMGSVPYLSRGATAPDIAGVS